MRASVRRQYLHAAVGIAALASVVAANNFFSGRYLSEDVVRLYSFVMLLLLVVWLMTDPDIPSDQRPSFDHGMLHWALFPVLAINQQFQIRRWRGVRIVFGLLVLVLAPYITFTILYAIAAR